MIHVITQTIHMFLEEIDPFRADDDGDDVKTDPRRLRCEAREYFLLLIQW